MNNSENKTDKKSIAYKTGYLAGAIIVCCVAALVVAVTAKIISLLF